MARERGSQIQDKSIDILGAFKLKHVAVTASAADLNVLTGGSAGGASKVQGGQATVTGAGTVTSTLATITSVVATLGASAALTGTYVTATFAGLVITLRVWKPTATGDCTPIASTTAVAVNWIATGT